MQQQGNVQAVAGQPAAPTAPSVTVNVPGANGATEAYQGLVAQRRELQQPDGASGRGTPRSAATAGAGGAVAGGSRRGWSSG